MRSHCILLLLFWLQCFRLSYAIGRGSPDGSEPAEPEQPPPEIPGYDPNKNPDDNPDSSGGGSGSSPKANVPGAISEGEEPKVSSDDDEVDIDEIAEKLKDLVEDISSLIDALTSTSTSTDANGSPTTIVTAYPTITSAPITGGAADCIKAQSAYAICSSANTNFTALPRTQQAGCLCNAQPNIDFNQDMANCYDWASQGPNASNTTQFRSYASAIANATSLCRPCPMSFVNGLPDLSGGDGCAASPSIAATSSTTAPASAGPTSGGVGDRVDGSGCHLLLMAFWVGLTSVVW